LPTEAEWEYACRAGTKTPFHFGTEINGREANLEGTEPYGTTTKGPYLQRTTSVGKYPENTFALHDMHGNVFEWCWDWYLPGYYAQGVNDNPLGPEGGTERVCRGGSYFVFEYGCRSTFRSMLKPTIPSRDIGFRVVRKAS
jgi:formylglycine-generating enzyme required for sulfatase activity